MIWIIVILPARHIAIGIIYFMKSASVMDTGTNTMMLVYSGIKEGSLTIHLQNHYDRPFDRIRVGNKTYGVDFSRKLRTKQVYVVSEVV